MSLLVTGTIGIDTVHTPTGKAENVLGGSCAYFAAAASHLTSVRVVAAVGGDWPAEHRKKLSQFANVDLQGLDVRKNSKTFAWGGKYLNNMDDRETLYTNLGVVEEAPPHIPPQYADSEFIFLANTHPAVQAQLLDHFPRPKMVVADTMNLWIDVARDDLLALLKRVDGIFLNYSEAEMLTGSRNGVTACRKMLDFGPKFAVNKKGEHGAIMVHRDGGVACLPAFPAEEHQVVDPTGAGDSFAGGMLGYIASTGKTDFQTVQSALAWGTVIASFAIESFSLDRLGKISRVDIESRLRGFQEAGRVG